jgi:hypothetical protein
LCAITAVRTVLRTVLRAVLRTLGPVPKGLRKTPHV